MIFLMLCEQREANGPTLFSRWAEYKAAARLHAERSRSPDLAPTSVDLRGSSVGSNAFPMGLERARRRCHPILSVSQTSAAR